jgi:Ca2+-binding EF-hand superfamily protein
VSPVRTVATFLAACLLAAAAPALAQQGQAASAPAKSPVEGIFDRWDADHNGVLSRDEFAKGWAAQAVIARKAAMESLQEGLHEQFAAVDANDNQGIDPGEYGELMLVRRAGDDAPAMATFDANADGRLQFEEYLQLVRRMAQPQARP